jgi:plastocyanin
LDDLLFRPEEAMSAGICGSVHGHEDRQVELKAGSYKYHCAAHEPTMFGRFKVK